MQKSGNIRANSVELKKRKALKISIYEGSAANFSSSIGETYITPFALALKAQPIHISLLSSFSSLLSPIAQVFSTKLMEKYPRKKIVMTSVLWQALMWLPIISLSYLFYKGIFQNNLIYILIILYSIFAAVGGFSYPAWFSWMGDLVPEKERGRYFSTRNRATGAVGLAAVIIGAFLLDAFKTRGFVLLGFSIIFFIAFLFKIISFKLFHKQYAPDLKLKKDYYFSLYEFIKKFDNYGKFAVYQALFNLAIMIASPFFAVYMLQDLKFNYVTYMIVSMSSSIFYLLFTPLAGRFSDRYGNKKLFKIASICFALNPILWLFIKTPLMLIFIPQIIVGIGNAALVIAETSFTYNSVSPQHRGICIAYTNIMIGIGAFLGSLLGGILINYIHPSNINPFFFVFIVAAVCRFSVPFFFLPYIKEKKKVVRLPPMHIRITHPFKTLHSEIGWIKKVTK